MSGLQLRRGTSGNLASVVASAGEPLFDTTNNALYVSDGSTPRYIGSPRRTEYAYAEFTAQAVTNFSTAVTLPIDATNAVLSSSNYFEADATQGLKCVRGGTYKLDASITVTAGNAPKRLELNFCEGGTAVGPTSFANPSRNSQSDTASITLIKAITAGTYVSVCAVCQGASSFPTPNSEVPASSSSIAITLLED